MERAFFEAGGIQLEYAVFGTGTEVVITFHGFGREAGDFEQFVPVLTANEKFISVNLFQHGNSQWPSQRSLTDSLKMDEHAFFLKALLNHLNVERFSLFAYSLGGKIAMQTCLLFPDRIDKLFLIAPDGLKKNRFYRFIVGTSVGRKLFKFTVFNPSLLLRSADVAHKLKLINSKLHRFVYVHMDAEKKRKQVYETWLIYRHFVPNLTELTAVLSTRKIDFTLLIGAYDSVIKAKDAQRFVLQLTTSDALVELQTGHQLMNEDVVNFIREQQIW